jgi:hypothetical protein
MVMGPSDMTPFSFADNNLSEEPIAFILKIL